MSSDNPDNSRRKFLSGSLTLVGGTGAAATLWPFLSSMAPSAKAKAAGAPVKVDISELKDGEKIDLIWRKNLYGLLKELKKCLIVLIQTKLSIKTHYLRILNNSRTLHKISLDQLGLKY